MNGNPIYPPNHGFDGPISVTRLKEGTVIDRYGMNPNGEYFSPGGTPKGARALPPNTKGYGQYVVTKDGGLNVYSGRATPWFGELGGGMQYMTVKDQGLNYMLRQQWLRIGGN